MNIPTIPLPTLLSFLSFAAFGQSDQGIKAPNVVAISERLVTSGQPTPESLANLSKQRFQAVIYLAPPSVPDAVANEPEVVRSQGLAFVNIPIQWSKPTEADFQSFVVAMKRFQGKKILVHCQANLRASAMTFMLIQMQHLQTGLWPLRGRSPNLLSSLTQNPHHKISGFRQ
jgi:protein tyrosine phosphatase (PTP) superfamily phosphohydrolase (DUF442 family)